MWSRIAVALVLVAAGVAIWFVTSTRQKQHADEARIALKAKLSSHQSVTTSPPAFDYSKRGSRQTQADSVPRFMPPKLEPVVFSEKAIVEMQGLNEQERALFIALKLSADQASQVKEIISRVRKRFNELGSQSGLDLKERENMRVLVSVVMAERDRDLKSILGPEKLAEYNQYQAQQHSKLAHEIATNPRFKLSQRAP